MNLRDVNTCYPAKIISFNPVDQVASCRLAIEKYFVGTTEGTYTKQKAPILLDVPVVVSQGGGWDITFPIAAGDDCLVMFAQKGYDQWLYSGAEETGMINGSPSPEHYRHFNEEDAVCIVGLRPITRAIPNYNTDGMEIRNESRNQRITLHSDGNIEINTVAKVVVNCSDAEVNAKSSVKVTTPKTTIDSPTTSITGNVSIGGTLSVAGGAGRAGQSSIVGNFKLTGNLDATGKLDAAGVVTGSDCIGGGKSLKGHTHTVTGIGAPTTKPD